MLRKRIFVAINLPENIKKELASFQDKWQEIPGRWIGERNIHITLAFLGYVADNELYEISKIVKEIAAKNEPFEIKLTKICYGPLEKGVRPGSDIGLTPKAPRMVWAMGEKSKEFSELRQNLEKALSSSENISYSAEKREFLPHITLCRIRQWEWRRIEPEERPEVDEDVKFNFWVDSIEIMESELRRTGPEYKVLESHPLGV